MTEENQSYSIGEVSKAVGFSKQTIKKYVKLGYVNCSRNPINNYRIFNQEALDILLKIKLGQYEVNKQ